jgi:hypothetical protein
LVYTEPISAGKEIPMAPRIRPPAVAGMFYPSSAEGLRTEVDRLLAGAGNVRRDFAGSHGSLKALIVPHAGYPYSGRTAAAAYAWLAAPGGDTRSAAIFGPSHRVAFPGLALPSWDSFATPLGALPVDRAMAESLLNLPFVHANDAAHAREHSIEVQLPFIRSIMPDIGILPVLTGRTTPAEVALAMETLMDRDGTIIIVSSDLSHYLPREEALLADGATIALIESLDASLDPERACGACAINGLLIAARNRRLRARKMDASDSADASGDASCVVGYASFGFFDGGGSDGR